MYSNNCIDDEQGWEVTEQSTNDDIYFHVHSWSCYIGEKVHSAMMLSGWRRPYEE